MVKNAVFDALAAAAQTGEPVALGIISGVKGSSPQKMGAKAVFYADGRITGTLGGGCLEAEIQQRAIQTLRTAQPARFELLLDHDFGWDDGLICGGKVSGLILPNAQKAGHKFWDELSRRTQTLRWGVTSQFELARIENLEGEGLLYRERVTPPCPFWIAGAGHIAQAVAPLATRLDFAVEVFDDRPALANGKLFPPEIRLHCGLWEQMLQMRPPEGPAFALIVTRGHRHDALVLQSWIREPFVFIGMIGSARKARTIFDHFLEEKLMRPEDLERIACPVGIRIRSQSVEEIAVSIMAQFIERRATLVTQRDEDSVIKLEQAAS